MLLIWGLRVTLFGSVKQGLDVRLWKSGSPSMTESATSWAASLVRRVRRIHLLLLKGPMLVGSLLVLR